MSSKYFVAPELHINIDDDQGVKKGEGEMVEGRQEVKVVVILKIGFFNILSDLFVHQKEWGILLWTFCRQINIYQIVLFTII